MLQLSDIAADPELGGVPFTILRDNMVLQNGEAILESRVDISTFGIVQPARDQDLSLVPEEYRSETLFTFYSPLCFSLGKRPDASHFTLPDKITWNDRSFLVIAVKDWSPFGFTRAIAVEKFESSS